MIKIRFYKQMIDNLMNKIMRNYFKKLLNKSYNSIKKIQPKAI